MKKLTLILIIIFSILAIDLPVMLAYESSVFSLSVSDSEQINTLDYVFGRSELTVDYSPEEVSHLEDVQRVIGWADYYFIFLLVVEIFLLVMIYRIEKKEFWKAFFYGGIVSSGVLLLTVFWALIDFNSLFTVFHQIFFPMGNWQFAADSKLVNLFSFEFFYGLVKGIFVKALIFSVLLVLVGLGLRKKFK
ncbi:MAG: DUF1461 domain-containing protein [Nanoarchaeota archaeon]|nr:DUF1461 domain-containing protein [Nanoarchaeota archaeon]